MIDKRPRLLMVAVFFRLSPPTVVNGLCWEEPGENSQVAPFLQEAGGGGDVVANEFGQFMYF